MLDELLADEEGIDFDWRDQAYDALVNFLANHNHVEFTADEFRRWADYYYNVPAPPHHSAWLYVFHRAKRARLIDGGGYRKNKSGTNVSVWTIL
jgi:hypothetical protein